MDYVVDTNLFSSVYEFRNKIHNYGKFSSDPIERAVFLQRAKKQLRQPEINQRIDFWLTRQFQLELERLQKRRTRLTLTE
jgi:hypothetical protein